MSTSLRTLPAAPAPTREFRRRAWRAFEEALERHLARRRGGLRPLELRR